MHYRPLFVYGRFCLNCDYPVQAGTMIFGKMQKMSDFVMEKCDFLDKNTLEKCEKWGIFALEKCNSHVEKKNIFLY